MMQKGTRYAECELRFHGESYGWEVQMFRDGELFSSRGALVTRGMAIQWAEPERREMGREGWTLVGTKGEA